jgi:hypothetical protein
VVLGIEKKNNTALSSSDLVKATKGLTALIPETDCGDELTTCHVCSIIAKYFKKTNIVLQEYLIDPCYP